MKILLTGATGLIGRSLAPHLQSQGHELMALTRGASRQPSKLPSIEWNPQGAEPSPALIEALDNAQPDLVIHLAGENIARKRWTAAQKQLIYDSRVKGTRLLVETFARMKRRPRRFLAASATGIYGERGDDEIMEGASAGSDFLAKVCVDWESAANRASSLQIEVVNLRFGVILSGHGGALAMMLPSFQIGLGARLGSGAQWMSWISLTDAVAAIAWIAANDQVRGPVNLVAPEPVRNADFTKTLNQQIRRPSFMRAPAFLLRGALGEMADMLLGSQRVIPQKLLNAGYAFQHPDLPSALAAELAT